MMAARVIANSGGTGRVAIMTRFFKPSGRSHRPTAFVLALILAVSVAAFGGERPCPEEEGVRTAASSSEPGQVPPRAELAALINGKRKVRIVMTVGEASCNDPVVVDEGLAVTKFNTEGTPIGAYNQVTIVPWDSIVEVKVRKSGIALGALTGLLVGSGLGYLGVSSLNDNPESSDYLQGMSIGGGLGALGGGLIGALFSGWKTVYRAPTGVRTAPLVSLMPAHGGGMIFSLSFSF